jgi:hypothetical protein
MLCVPPHLRLPQGRRANIGFAHDLEAQARARLVRAALAARPMLDGWAGAGGVGKL